MEESFERTWKRVSPTRFEVFTEYWKLYSILGIAAGVLLIGAFLICLAGFERSVSARGELLAVELALFTPVMTAWAVDFVIRQRNDLEEVRAKRKSIRARKNAAKMKAMIQDEHT